MIKCSLCVRRRKLPVVPLLAGVLGVEVKSRFTMGTLGVLEDSGREGASSLRLLAYAACSSLCSLSDTQQLVTTDQNNEASLISQSLTSRPALGRPLSAWLWCTGSPLASIWSRGPARRRYRRNRILSYTPGQTAGR